MEPHPWPWCPLNMTVINSQNCWTESHLPAFLPLGLLLKQAGKKFVDKLKKKKKKLIKSIKPELSEQGMPLAGDLGVISAVRDLYCFHPALQGWSFPRVGGVTAGTCLA